MEDPHYENIDDAPVTYRNVAQVYVLENVTSPTKIGKRVGVTRTRVNQILAKKVVQDHIRYLQQHLAETEYELSLDKEMDALRKDALAWAREAINDETVDAKEKIRLLTFAADYHPDRKLVKTVRQEHQHSHEVVASEELAQLREVMLERFPGRQLPKVEDSEVIDAEFEVKGDGEPEEGLDE